MKRITNIKRESYCLVIEMTVIHKNIAVTFIYQYENAKTKHSSPHIYHCTALKENITNGGGDCGTFGTKKTFYNVQPSAKWGYNTYDLLLASGEEAVWKELEYRVSYLQEEFGIKKKSIEKDSDLKIIEEIVGLL
jgi:hypothetical protein